MTWVALCLDVPVESKAEYSSAPVGCVECLAVQGPELWWLEHVRELRKTRCLPQLVVVVHGQSVHSEWTLAGLVERVPQGTLWRRTAWYTRESCIQYLEGKECPLALPEPSSVERNERVVVHNERAGRAIHQTWMSQEQLSAGQRGNVAKIQRLNPDRAHWLWSDAACRTFVAENFDVRLVQVYEDLIPGAFRADVWRLCALYAFGGTYLDIDLDLFVPIASAVPAWCELTLCKDDVRAVPNDNLYLYNAIIDARAAGHPFFTWAMARVLTHVQAKRLEEPISRVNALFVTGPCSFGLAFEDSGLPAARHLHLYVTNERVEGADRCIRSRVTGDVVGNTKYRGADQEDGIGAYHTTKAYFHSDNKRVRSQELAVTKTAAPAVYDVFLYNGEKQTLKLRLETLRSVVTRTFVVEFDRTFAGKPKPRYFLECGLSSAELANVVYLALQDPSAAPDGDLMQRELAQRDAAFKAMLLHTPVADSDYIIFADCDEIPEPEQVRTLVEARSPGKVFRPHWFHFNFSNYLGLWLHQQLNVATLRSYRTHRAKDGQFRLNHLHQHLPCETGGWHASYFMSAAEVLVKLQQYAHANEERERQLVARGEEFVVQKIRAGGELFNHNGLTKACPYWGRFPAKAGPELFGPVVPTEIPKRVVSIWITAGAKNPKQLPAGALRQLQTQPGLEHVHIDDAAAEALLTTGALRELYSALPENKYRADLLRFLYLYEHGGWYVDVDTDLVRPLVTFVAAPHVDLYTVLSTHKSNVCIGTFFVTPRHVVVGRILGEMQRIGTAFKHITSPPWTDHPTHVAYRVLQEYLGSAAELRVGVHTLADGRAVQLDEEVYVPEHDDYAIVQAERGALAWQHAPWYRKLQKNPGF